MKKFILFLVLVVLSWPAWASTNIFPQGDFERLDASGKPIGWDRVPHVGWLRSWGANFEIVKEGTNHYARFTDNSSSVADSKKGVWLEAYLPLDPSWKYIRVTCRMRAKIRGLGGEDWFGAKVTMQFEDENGKAVRPYPPQPTLREDQPLWQFFAVRFPIPPGAKRLAIKPGLWGAIGVMSIDDITVVPE